MAARTAKPVPVHAPVEDHADGAAAVADAPVPCFMAAKVRIPICLPPSYMEKPAPGIMEILNSKLMKYDSGLEGVLCSYTAIKLCENAGRIIDELPFIHFSVDVDGVVFVPKVGSTLTGKVTKTGADHIGCLVFATFNAAIPRDGITANYTFSHTTGRWESDVHSIGVGDVLTFTVTAVQDSLGIMSIVGTLAKPDKRVRPTSEVTPAKKRRRTKEVETPAAAPAPAPAPAATPARTPAPKAAAAATPATGHKSKKSSKQ